MNKAGALFVIIAMASILTLALHIQRRRALRHFWDRHCMGIRWRRRFPDVPKTEIREFLTIFVDAFGFSHTKRTYFSPEDRVIDVYRAENPPGSFSDNMELETLGLNLEKRYGIDFTTAWREDITLGELYEYTRKRVT